MSGNLVDTRVDVKVVLSGLWTATMLVFAYVDIFGFFRADVVEGALAGRVSGTTFAVDQTFLLLTTLYVAVPAVLVAVSLVAPARVGRPANLVAGVVYAVTVGLAAVGETWAYYIAGTVVEVVLLSVILRVAWAWPRNGRA